jgi:hypothetical protein
LVGLHYIHDVLTVDFERPFDIVVVEEVAVAKDELKVE